MRTNKACPLYSGSLSAPLSPEHEDAPPDPEDDLGYVDGTKLTLPSKLIKVTLFIIRSLYYPIEVFGAYFKGLGTLFCHAFVEIILSI